MSFESVTWWNYNSFFVELIVSSFTIEADAREFGRRIAHKLRLRSSGFALFAEDGTHIKGIDLSAQAFEVHLDGQPKLRPRIIEDEHLVPCDLSSLIAMLKERQDLSFECLSYGVRRVA